MAPNRADRSDRENSHSRASRHTHRSKRDSHDDVSVDSGYGGSSATISPRFAQRGLPRGQETLPPRQDRPEAMPKHDTDKGAEGHGTDQDSDSDYDPKAKYYLTVDEDAYRDISFQSGKPANKAQSSKAKGKRREIDGDDPTRRPKSRHGRHRSYTHRDRSDSRSSSSDSDASDSRADRSRSRRASSRRYSDAPRPRRDSFRPPPSPVMPELSEISQEVRKSLRHRQRSRDHNDSRISSRRRRASSAYPSDESDAEPEGEEQRVEKLTEEQQLQQEQQERVRSRSRPRSRPRAESSRKLGKAGSSSYAGAADMDDAWYKTFKERITKGVDMNQVKKVGLDAAAVAAVKVAVGTQIPWKQRIPKTIAVGLAAAVTDFIVSKTTFQPKGMVGTMYARQLVEIILANLIINPVSNKVTSAAQKSKGKGNDQAGKSSGGGVARGGGGRARR